MLKSLRIPRIEGNYLSLIEDMQNLKASIILNGKILCMSHLRMSNLNNKKAHHPILKREKLF